MGLYQSFMQVFVTNNPALLAQGQTVDNLAVGQIGILDAKTYTGVTSPTYAKNKAIYAVWGTPDINLGDFGGVPNENEYSKLIKGKQVKRIRAKKAQRGQTPIYTIGWSGDAADTDTLSAKSGEQKSLFIKLTGTIIDRLYSTQGITKQFIYEPPCITDCDDTCADLLCPDIANQLVAQINADKDFSKFIRSKAIIECTGQTPPVTTTCYKFRLDVCDTGDDIALGLVQAQYPDDKVTRVARNGANSSYGVVRDANTLPDAYESATIVVPECPDCPDGATLVPEAKVFLVQVPSEGAAPALPGQTAAVVLKTGPQFDMYTVTFPVTADNDAIIAAADAAGIVATFAGVRRNICTVPPTEYPWVADGTLLRQSKDYTITLADSICGTNRLADLQAAYPDLVISVVNPAGDCVHTYQTSVPSNCYEDGCAIEEIKFVAPDTFEGVSWKEVPAAPPGEDVTCKCGIQIETAFFNRETNECTFDAFPYENDIVHVQISNYNPDYNASPCEDEWAVKQIRQVKYPMGHGAYVQRLEKNSKAYDRRHRNFDPVVRDVQGYSLQADPQKYYDQYVIEFDHTWNTAGGWAEKYTDSYHLMFFVPEGMGTQIEAALNAYATSAGIEIDGVAI